MTDLHETTLPSLLDSARALAAAGPIDTSPLRAGALLFDLGAHDRVIVSGRDRVRFLHAMLSNDVKELVAGGGRWATFNTVQGRTVCDVRLFDLDDDRKTGSILALLEPGARGRFVDGLDKYVISEKVFFEDDVDGALLLVAGAGAEAVLPAVPPAEPYSHVEASIAGAPVRILRLDRSGPEAQDFGLWLRAADVPAVSESLGLPAGPPELLEAARIEAGQVRFGIDITSSNIPLEAGLKERAISFTKGCYIGQEVICRIDSLGTPAKKLVRLELQGAPPEPGTDLFRAGKAVGFVTSALATPAGALAFGYLRKRSNDPGTVVHVGSAEGPEATVGEAL